MSMAQGFAQGFGMMNQYMAQKSEQERQAALDAENNRRYQEGIEWRNKTYTDQQTRQQKQDEEAAENRTLTQAQLGLTPDMTPEQKAGYLQNMHAVKLQQDAEDRQWAKKKDELSMQATRANIAKTALDTRAAKLDLEDKQFQRSLTKLYMGAGSDDDVLALGDYGRGLAKRSNEFNAFAQQFSQLNDAVSKAETIDDRERSVGQLLGLMDSDIGRNVMNSAFMSSYAKRMKQDENIVSISSAGFMPLQGKLVPLMDIEYKDGTIKRGVPATTGKSGKSDDTVVALSPEHIRQQVAQAYTIQGQVKAKIDENPALAQKLGLKEKPVQLGYGAQLIDPNTGEVVANNERTATRDYAAEEAGKDKRALQASLKGELIALRNQYAQEFQPEKKKLLENEMIKIESALRKVQDEIAGTGSSITQAQPKQAQGMQPTTSGAKTGGSQFSYGKIGINPDSIPNKK